MAQLLFVGALTQDTVLRVESLPTAQGKYIATGAVQIAAGMASSAACAASRLGGKAALWATTGDDAVGDQLVAGISGEGVDCAQVRRVPNGASAVSAILIDPAGERVIVPYYDAKTHADPASFPFDIQRFDAVMVDVRWLGAAEMALRAAKAAGKLAILDADTAPLATLERLLPHATHVAASEPAASLLTSGLPPAQACAALADRTGTFVAVTSGGSGTFWTPTGENKVRHTPAPQIVAVDTLSAGDVFHGALTLALAEGMEAETAIRFASAAAAVKCTRFGGRLGAPTRVEVMDMMKRSE